MNRVTENNFSVEVLYNGANAQKVNKNNGNYFALPHNTEYKLRLSQSRSVNTDATVYVDGKEVGTWRLGKYRGSITIERPSDVAKKFTFLQEGTSEASDAGISTGKSENGIVRVVFKPEKEYVCNHCHCTADDYYMYGHFRGCGCKYLGMESQSFNNVLRKSKNKNQSKSYDNLSHTDSYGDSDNNLTLNSSTNGTESYQHGGTGLGETSNQYFSTISAIQNVDSLNITEITVRLLIDNDAQPVERTFVPLHSIHCNNKTSYPQRLDNNIRAYNE